MAQKNVAVLDVRSNEVTVLVGQRNVNRTFVIKASRTETYGGYENGVFYKDDKEKISDAILRAIDAVELVCGERIRTLYVGVPGDFTTVVTKNQDIGFPKKRKVTARDTAAIYETGRGEVKGSRYMRASSMLYVTNDKQHVVDPIGISTAGMTGCISYFYCSEYFCSVIEETLKGRRINVKYLPTQFAMAYYLIPSETRDECALFLDFGFLASTLCVVLGNGVMEQGSFWAGKGQIAFLIMERLNVTYPVALALMHKVNLFANKESGNAERAQLLYRGEVYEYSPAELAQTVEEGLDNICEEIESFLLSKFDESEIDYKPLYVSGEGIENIRGAVEHISKRLNRILETVAPELPYYNTPAMSSRLALLDMACEDSRRSGFLYRIFNGFGG